MPHMNRRTVAAAIGAAALAIPAACLPGRASVSSDLPRLIKDHRAAYRAFCKAIDREQEMEAAFEGREHEDIADAYAGAKRDLEATGEAEWEAAIAVCAYQCQTLEEARLKAAYLATAPGLKDGLQPEHIEALLASFGQAVAS